MQYFPTLSRVPAVTPSGIQFKTNTTEFENGIEQSSPAWSRGKRRFTLSYEYLPKADALSIDAFFIARKGAHERFYWVNPLDGQTYAVKFAADELRIQWQNAEFANITLEVKE